ncbi:MAG: Macrolide export ATP-binding/permease protein MacB [Luteibacter sp.]|uniref:ABC transporter permease n=1 Tax=Luteibacter sp. TaxID=1886636 RepID=UPI00138217C1|nr:FtsX-like permease family protein [Luteibacter sp.]KAF1006672.1 MAG: Macrolide export ATP-binding/permease protein MacB [Luteibacter sp.]
MFAYYLELAWRSLRRNKSLTALMIFAVALGIGACMTTLTVVHVLSGDPLPGRGDRVYRVLLDAEPMDSYRKDGNPLDQVTWVDGMNLLRDGKADRQALMTGGNVAVTPPDASLDPFYIGARYSTSDIFSLFGIHFIYGGAWTAKDDASRARVAVITRRLNDKVFGGANSVGRNLRVSDADLRVIGVIDDWDPQPHFHDLDMNTYGDSERLYLPLGTSRDLGLGHSGSTNCYGNGRSSEKELETQSCTWLQYWVELDTAAKRDAYHEYLVNYSRAQHDHGRFERPPNVRLFDVMSWLDYKRVVPGDVKIQAWLAIGFLIVCLVNTVGLMLAKFLRRSGEVGVRRALGATRGEILTQLLTEAGMIGLAGGIGGLVLAILGLWLVRMQPHEYAKLAHLDFTMFLATFALAIASTVVAGLLPALRACRVAPALQLKTQ